MYNIDVGGDERRVEELEGLEGGGKLSSIDLKGSLSPLPEPRSWACKGVFWSSTTLCKTPST